MGRGWKSFEVHVRKSIDCIQEIVIRNIKGVSGEASDGNEEHVIRCWRKSDPCYKVAENVV